MVSRSRRGAAGLVVVALLAVSLLAVPSSALAAKGSGSTGASGSKSRSGSNGGAGLVSTTSTDAIGGAVPTVPGVTPSTTTEPQIVATTSSTGSGSGVSGGEAIAIAAIAVLLIAGIGYAILRDARKRTPKGKVSTSIDRTPGSQRPPKARKLSAAERKRRKRGRTPRR